jgi:ADP-ribosylglycohydrolase
VSDDTEHACIVAQALLEHGDDPEGFARALARRLRWWLAALPAAVGFATLRGITKLWLGFSPRTSGVFSAGNGAAMRAPLIGVWAAGDAQLRRELVRASTRLTHSDPRAEQGAQVVAAAAAMAAVSAEAAADPRAVIAALLHEVHDDALGRALSAAVDPEPLEAYADRLGLERGVTGFVGHTVPVAIAAWLRHSASFRDAIEDTVRLGGDTDTTSAIVGALVGTCRGPGAIPESWLGGLVEQPRSVAWMGRLSERLASRGPPLELAWPLLLLRNAACFMVVLGVAGRRALPPY